MSILSPESYDLLDTIRLTIKQIKPLERVQVVVPREYYHHCWGEKDGEEVLDWEIIEELQMTFCGSYLGPNIFVALRFDHDDDEPSKFILDICHFPS